MDILSVITELSTLAFKPNVPLSAQYHFEILRQLILHSMDITSPVYRSMTELNAHMAAGLMCLRVWRAGRPHLVRSVPWGSQGAVYQRCFDRHPTVKVPLGGLLANFALDSITLDVDRIL